MPALVVSGAIDQPTLRACFDLGASFLLKPLEPGRLSRFAAQAVARPPAERVELSPDELGARVAPWKEAYGLTPTQTALVEAVLGGSTYQQFAARQGCTVSTARRHASEVLDRCGFGTMAALVVAIRAGGPPPGRRAR